MSGVGDDGMVDSTRRTANSQPSLNQPSLFGTVDDVVGVHRHSHADHQQLDDMLPHAAGQLKSWQSALGYRDFLIELTSCDLIQDALR